MDPQKQLSFINYKSFKYCPKFAFIMKWRCKAHVSLPGLDIDACLEFVNYSCGASENCILLAPLESTFCINFRFTFDNVCKFRGLPAIQACPRKYAFTCQNHVLLGFK